MSNNSVAGEESWKPSVSLVNLRKRAKIISEIREFFALRNVMEVDTPALSHYSVTDPFLMPFETQLVGPDAVNGKSLFLQTSPEYAMKRLLAAGSGCIYQLAKAFRNEEYGRYHNPEFTMLEWYRVGFDDVALMNEIEDLLKRILPVTCCERKSYQDAFLEFVGLDPLTAKDAELSQALIKLGMENLLTDEISRDDMLQLLFSEYVEKSIGQQVPCFIYNFPASQASLAKLVAEDPRVAHRFELYFKGVELANGFYELTDAKEQCTRFDADNQKRKRLNIEQRAVDLRFISALSSGLPECAGVALGVDRLLMLALDAKHIDEVIAFPVHRA